MKRKLNFNVEVLGLNQKPMLDEDNKPMVLNKGLALNLANLTDGDSVKLYGWAVELEAGKVLELDISDQELLKKTITALPLAALLKAQLLMIFIK